MVTPCLQFQDFRQSRNHSEGFGEARASVPCTSVIFCICWVMVPSRFWGRTRSGKGCTSSVCGFNGACSGHRETPSHPVCPMACSHLWGRPIVHTEGWWKGLAAEGPWQAGNCRADRRQEGRVPPLKQLGRWECVWGWRGAAFPALVSYQTVGGMDLTLRRELVAEKLGHWFLAGTHAVAALRVEAGGPCTQLARKAAGGSCGEGREASAPHSCILRQQRGWGCFPLGSWLLLRGEVGNFGSIPVVRDFVFQARRSTTTAEKQ